MAIYDTRRRRSKFYIGLCYACVATGLGWLALILGTLLFDLLTPDDVCALLKVKKSWLYDAVENGALEAIRLGKQLRFRPSALVRYLEEHVSNMNQD